ncbi:SPOR domain-containing protein [Novosphingobium huizhouense]|uniref:SPOR domain-containing protein n=1 Tax=Novosphingobium huizhouense TaxID=2866625 RepID=UPI001CD8CBB1|nr:SPOR domain-containing protein [Novosphingobium huizhouense]
MKRRTVSRQVPVTRCRADAVALALAAAPLALAPLGGALAQPVVQPTGPGAVSPSQALNAALTRLARDPRNLTALIDAGTAALQLGDTDAAVGFFSRANEIAPGNGQVKAQIATAMLRADRPTDAIRYFDEAQAAGADLMPFAADRGLAYDLVGDNAAAQRLYQQALARGGSDELVRRQAVSLAIAGDRRGAEATLAPLVQRQDRAAWRARTFIMAITGNPDEAVSVAYASMPQDLAAGIAPYLRFMPRLTAAQQAAAANLGRFPRAADIGRDDPKIAEYAALHPRAPRIDQGLIPAGAALGGNGAQKGAQVASRDKRRRPGRDQQLALATPPRQAATQAGTQVANTTVPPAPTLAAVPQAAAQGYAQTGGQTGAQTGAQVAAASVAVPVVQPTPGASSSLATAASPADPGTAARAPSVAAPYPLARIDMAPGAAPPPRVTTIPVTRRQVQPLPPSAQPASGAITAGPVAGSPATAGPVAGAPVAVGPSPVPAPSPAPGPRPAPAPVVAGPVPTESAEAAPPAADFRALFDGFRAPEEEQRSAVAAVDLATIRPRGRSAPPKPAVAASSPVAAPGKGAKVAADEAPAAKDGKSAKAAGRTGARGERPDGPTAVSRTTEREVRVAQVDEDSDAKGGKGAKSAKDAKSGKDAKDTKGAKDAKDGKGGKGAKDAKSKAGPSHPSRIWVQVLSGGNRDQMGKEWRGLVKEAGALKARKPYLSAWRGNFRLLTGPFESDAAAQDFVRTLKKDGVSSYQWTSPAGQAVDPLALD